MAKKKKVRKKKLISLDPHIEEWKDCKKCPLHRGAFLHVLFRTNSILPGPCDLLLVGEAPGPREDEVGEPFVGPAGRILNAMLAEVREKVGEFTFYIANTVGCIPLKQSEQYADRSTFRAPTTEEQTACLPRVIQLTELVRPTGIILMGVVAQKGLYSEYLEEKNFPNVLNVWHPSYVNRKGGVTSYEFGKTVLLMQRFIEEL